MGTQLLYFKIAAVCFIGISIILSAEFALAAQSVSENWRISPRLVRIENPMAQDASSLNAG
jgi:hypothetical protein